MDRLYSFKGFGGIGNADRSKKFQRYDPQCRKYVEWETENNWFDQGPIVPRYTWKEHEYLSRYPRRRLEGKEYGSGRPKVGLDHLFDELSQLITSLLPLLAITYPEEDRVLTHHQRLNPEHQPFWHRARRIADNRLAGYMEETDNLRADAHYLSFIDRARGTPGLSRRHTIGVASHGLPDGYMGGPRVRRQLSPIWADYNGRKDDRGWGVPDQSWVEDDVDGMYWGPVGATRGEYMW